MLTNERLGGLIRVTVFTRYKIATRKRKYPCRRCGEIVTKGDVYYYGAGYTPIHVDCDSPGDAVVKVVWYRDMELGSTSYEKFKDLARLQDQRPVGTELSAYDAQGELIDLDSLPRLKRPEKKSAHYATPF